MKCLKVFKIGMTPPKHISGKYICPIYNCNGHIIECDELMIPIIIELTSKGYRTEYCCSSHILEMKGRQNPKTQMYIKFQGGLKSDAYPEYPPEGFEFIISDVDGGLTLKAADILDYENRVPVKNIKKSDLQQILFENLQKILRWAEELPPSKYLQVHFPTPE